MEPALALKGYSARTGTFPTYRLPDDMGEWSDPISSGPYLRPAGKANVSYTPETPFDTIEGSYDYVMMLAESLAEARQDVEEQVAAAMKEGAERRKDALLLASYNLTKLDLHVASCRRILNDLRTLRRLLLAERGAPERESRGVLEGD